MPAKQYRREMGRRFEMIAVWPPTQIVRLGEVGRLNGVRFDPMTTLSALGIPQVEGPKGPPATMEYTSEGRVTIAIKGSGDLPVAGSALTQAEAGATISFDRSNAVVFKAKEASVCRLDQLDKLGARLLGAYKEGLWDKDLAVVVELISAGSSTVLISSSSDASVDIRASGDVAAGAVDIANAELGLTLKRSTAIATRFLCEEGLTPLVKLLRIKRSFFSAPRPVITPEALGSPMDLFEVVPWAVPQE